MQIDGMGPDRGFPSHAEMEAHARVTELVGRSLAVELRIPVLPGGKSPGQSIPEHGSKGPDYYPNTAPKSTALNLKLV